MENWYFSFFFPEDRVWHFMLWRQLHVAWKAKAYFLVKKWKKYFKVSSAKIFTDHSKCSISFSEKGAYITRLGIREQWQVTHQVPLPLSSNHLWYFCCCVCLSMHITTTALLVLDPLAYSWVTSSTGLLEIMWSLKNPMSQVLLL